MTAFLFIADDNNARLTRRVEFSNIASLFVEADEPPRSRGWSRGLRVAATLVLLLLAVGDTVLVAHPGALDWSSARQIRSGAERTVTL